MNTVKMENIQPKNIVKITVNNDRQVAALPVKRVTKTQVIVEGNNGELRFRRVDGKEVSANGAVETRRSLAIKTYDIIRFA